MLDKEVIKREIDKLPEDVLGELFDFIQFLETTRVSQELSTGSFQRIWDNEEDAVYDTIQSSFEGPSKR